MTIGESLGQERFTRQSRAAHVMLFAINFPPEPTGVAINTADWVQQLAESGYRVTVMAGVPHYPGWKVYDGYRRRFRMNERIHSNILIRRFGLYVPRKQSAVSRGLYELSFLLNAGLVRPDPAVDAVIGIVPALTGGWLARWRSQAAHVPFGLIFADLMGRAAKQSGVPGAQRIASSIEWMELSLARCADRVGVIAQGFVPYLVDGGVSASRLDRIFNRNRAHEQIPTAPSDAVRRRLGWHPHEFVIVHAGNMGYKQALSNALHAARLLGPEFRLVLVGDGNQRETLIELANRIGANNVEFVPLLPPQEYANLMSAADVLLLNQRGTVTDMSLPGKITNYMAAGKAVVAAVASVSEAARELNQSGAAVVVPPESPESLAEAIRRLRSDAALRHKLASAGPLYAQRQVEQASTGGIVAFVDRTLSMRRDS